jgi:aspartate/methionine/tyrosine aminotransferase
MGWMIAPQSLVAQATALADIVFHGLPGFVQEAASAAILDKTTPERAVEVYRRRREARRRAQPERGPDRQNARGWPFHSLRHPKHRFNQLAVCRACSARRGGSARRRRALWPSHRRLRARRADRPEDVLVKAGRRLGALCHHFDGTHSKRKTVARPAPGGRLAPELVDRGCSAPEVDNV